MCVCVHWLKNYHRHIRIKLSEIFDQMYLVKNVPELQKVVRVINISVGSRINGKVVCYQLKIVSNREPLVH